MAFNDSTVTPFTTTKRVLDCSGNDSGKNECWSNWLNIGVPIFMSLTFVTILLVMFICWPKLIKPSNADAEANGDTKKLTENFKDNNHAVIIEEEETKIARL